MKLTEIAERAPSIGDWAYANSATAQYVLEEARKQGLSDDEIDRVFAEVESGIVCCLNCAMHRYAEEIGVDPWSSTSTKGLRQ